MADRSQESDWKIFRDLRQVALERFCRRVLDEAQRFCMNATPSATERHSSHSHHERYLELYRWLQDRDEELARAFNDPKRSRMRWQLAAIHAYGLLNSDELARFSPQTRDTIELLTKEFSL